MGESEASPPLSDIGGDKMTRTSSQTSGASTNSKKTYPARRTPKTVSKSPSISSLKRDPSLTSFPSLSPEHVGSQQDVPKLPSPPRPSRTTSQKVRDRKKTLASLTSASGSFQGQSSLFDDSPRSSLDIPGALHLASDEHIERLIARSGAVKLVRQFAQDLALRDAELSSLRSRADERERELKKMLREVEVSSANIERRLQSLENTSSHPEMAAEARPGVARNVTTRIDNMVHQAMAEGLEDDHVATAAEVDPSATVRPIKSSDIASQNPATESSQSRSREGSGSGWQLRSANAASPDASTASSVLEGDANDSNATAKPRVPSSNTKRRGLDTLFQTSTQSSSYFIGGAHKTVKKPAGDDASVHSQKSNRSMGWTKIFAGTSLAVKEDAGRPRSSSLEQDKSGQLKTSAAAADSAMLSRVRTNPAKAQSSSKLNVLASSNTSKAKPTGRRTPTSGPPMGPEHVRRDSDATSLGPVEMDTILDAAAKPPTMTHAYNNYQSQGLLTDRFGFIYDQRQRKRQKQALAATKMNRLSGMSGVESLSTFRTDSDSADENYMDLNRRLSPPIRPATPTSIEEESQLKKWSDYLKVPAKLSNIRPTELLSHTPSAGAVITVSTADASGTITPPKARETSISVRSQLALPITSFIPKPSQSSVTADSPTFASYQNHVVANSVDQEPVKLLLEQLTELHDTLQAEREAKFNDFLRKVRAERSTTVSSDRVSNNVPEADTPNGELIGNLGHAKNRAKYLQFKALVLSGIPVSLRPRVWAECSGASTLRIPGYYEELVVKSQSDENMDPDIAQQIAADVPRTLTDNSMFRFGPGMGKLSEILKAYSLHNPAVGYCQGMNLITGSLLLICVTSEDVFWLLCAIVDKIMPSGYFDRGLRSSRADQAVLRSYVSEVLPKLDAKLEELGVELEACTFQWFLSLYSAVVSAEPLFRIWDVVLCLQSSESQPQEATSSLAEAMSPTTSSATAAEGNGQEEWHDGTCSPFLFQLSLALLKLNEASLLALESAAQVYQYVNHNMTNHAIGVDQLISAAEALRVKVKREDVLARRRKALKEIT